MARRTEDLDVIARALSISERISLSSRLPPRTDEESRAVEARVEDWARRVSPDGSEARFAERLAWLSLDRAGAVEVASVSALPETFRRPAWFEIADQVRQRLRHDPEPAPADVAFGEYWQGWAAVGRERLEARLGATGCDLPAAVLAHLERGLVTELSSLGSTCLMSAFDEHRLPWQLGPDYLIARLGTKPPTALYESFVRQLRQSSLVWARWPALIRLCATRVSFWVDSVGEFALRSRTDREALEAVVGRDLGPIASVERVSDSHDGGRRVLVVTFGHGVRVVYKPRGVRSELAFVRVLDWINSRSSGGPRLEGYWVIDRDRYGWTEHIAPAPCPGSESSLYYARAGMLLGLAYVLAGSDCHEENVIARGACPVLVDLETFAGPLLSLSTDLDAEYVEAIQRFETDSVLAIGMLPGWVWGPPDADNSGLLGDGKGRRLRFADLNTDLMRVVQVDEPAARLRANQPRLASGAAIEAGLHVDSLLEGFERVYTLVAENLDDFLRPDGPVSSLRDGLARVVFRDTRQYAQVLAASVKPRALEDGFARGVSMDGLSSLLFEIGPPDWASAFLAEEQDALFRGDIPTFLADRRDGTLLAQVPGLDRPRDLGRMPAEGTGVRRLESRLRRLGPADLRVQRQCIEAAFIGRAIRSNASTLPAVRPTAEREPGECLEEAALAMARAVQECSLAGSRGGRFWLGFESDARDASTSRVGVLGPWLYAGQAGIALALSAAFARCRSPELSSASLAALAPVRELVLADAGVAPIGAFDGLPGVAFALWHSARLLDEPALADDARRLLRSIDRHMVERDELFDVVSGGAGLVLAVRCLEAADGPRVREVVEASARHLVSHAKRFDGGVGWTSFMEPQPLCGVAHGNSGIAWALMEAFRVTGDPTFREVSLAAASYERARRAETAAGAWPDLRGKPTHPTGWCHGPAGIALARCAMLEIDDSAQLRSDLEVARALMEDHAESEPRAHLCCGQTGIDDIMLELGHRLHDSASIERARARASARIRRLGDDPSRWMHPDRVTEGNASAPGLMKGWSGIILTLLRLSDPGRVIPGVLALEA